MSPLAFIIAGILTGAIVCAFGWFMPAHTEKGARTLEGVLDLKISSYTLNRNASIA